MKLEVLAVGLKARREKRGLTERKLGHDLGISSTDRVLHPVATKP
jgi:hypothetical protein